MAAHLKFALALMLAVVICALSTRTYAEDAAPAPAPAAADAKPAEAAPAPAAPAPAVAAAPAPAPEAPPAPAPAPAAIPEMTEAPKGCKLVLIDGKQCFVDKHLNVVGVPPGAKGSAEDEAAKKLKELQEKAARVVEEDKIQGAILRLSTGGWREAQADLLSFGKDAVPFLIDAMNNVDADGSSAPATFQLDGHTKADASHATRQRTRGEVCADLLTEMMTNHSNYKGDLPTLSQQDWKDWWAANSEKITIGR